MRRYVTWGGIRVVGRCNIPENKAQEFENNVLHVMDIGGMMRFEQISVYGKSVHLLQKASKLDDDLGSYWASYNYFEEDSWEYMGYNPKNKRVYSNKLGWSVFNRVTGICHMLEEVYSGQCYVGGDLYMEPAYMTYWINHEFGADFDLNHRTNIYRVYQALKSDLYYRDNDPHCDAIMSYSTFLGNGANYFTRSSVRKLREHFLLSHTSEETENIFKELREDMIVVDNFCTKGLFLCIEALMYVGKCNLSTYRILGCDSDDDRLYWWTDGAFDLSCDCLAWLDRIKEDHQCIMHNMHTARQDGDKMLKTLLNILEHINDVYGRMFMFKEGFYDMMERKNIIAVQATVKLLEFISLRGEADIRALEGSDEDGNDWRKIKHSRPRMEMKRFMALLGNRELRKKVLGF